MASSVGGTYDWAVPGQLMFVQFPHPGPEHRPKGSFMDWNRSEHARKFLKASGTYVRDGARFRGELVFWGEWEPQSIVSEIKRPESEAHPHWVHDPVWQVPRHRQLLQNTDPLVFGDRFIYSNCRQHQNGKLQELAPDSLVVFGSKVAGEFAVDTVFVVGDGTERFGASRAGSVPCPEWVRAVVFDPIEQSAKKAGRVYRLYRGRSQQDAPSGPFSFVPCRPYVGRPPGFARPRLRLSDKWMTTNLTRGAKATPATRDEIEHLWHEVVDQIVVGPGLAMGVELDPPPPLEQVQAT